MQRKKKGYSRVRNKRAIQTRTGFLWRPQKKHVPIIMANVKLLIGLIVIKSIKVTRKLPDGVYVRRMVQGYPVLFTADTGVSTTIISNRVFKSLKEEDRAELVKTS